MGKLYGKIAYHAGHTPDNKAFTYRILEEYESVDYGTLRRYVDSLSFHLREYQGQTIAIIGNNKLEYAVSLLAILSSGQTAFLIDKELGQEDVAKLLGRRRPGLILLDDELESSLEPSLGGCPIYRFSDVCTMMKEGRGHVRESDEPGRLLLHTSGTTGEPKLVLLDEEKYFGVIPELNEKWGVVSRHSCLLIIPLYHVYALTSLFHGLYAGINNILEWDYKRLGRVLAETRPHLFMGVPLMYQKIMETARKKAGWKLEAAIFLSNLLRHVGIDVRKKWFREIQGYFGGNYVFGVSAGSPLPERTGRFFRDVGLPVYNVYGMTETAGPVAINYEGHNQMRSVGEILRRNEVRIENADERGIGHVCVRGSNIFEGYLGETSCDGSGTALDEASLDGSGTALDETKKDGKVSGYEGDLNHGGRYFDTGDLGYVKDGYLYVVGRENGILIGANGKNVSAEELRRKMMETHGIYGCKVIMEKDKLVAIVNTDLDGKELEKCLEKLNQKLPRYKRISEIRPTDERLK